jgi:hypothetical protein
VPNKLSQSKLFTVIIMKKPSRARVVPTDDRNEFIRLRQTDVNEREPGASGALKSSLNLKKIQKPYFPKANPILPEVQVDSPVALDDVKKEKKKKNQKLGRGHTKPKSSKKSRHSSGKASLLAAECHSEDVPLDLGEQSEDLDLGEQQVGPVPDISDAGAAPEDVGAGDADEGLVRIEVPEDTSVVAKALADAVDKNGLTYVEPAKVLPAETRAHWHNGRGIVASKLMPIKPENMESFVRVVKAASFKRWHLYPVVSSRIRKLVLRDLRDVFCVKMSDAETLLQMSYVVFQKFVAGPGESAVEHFNIAFAIGQIHFWNEERIEELGKWDEHDDLPELDPEEELCGFVSPAGPGLEGEGREAASPVTPCMALSTKSDASHRAESSPTKGSPVSRAVRLPGSGTPQPLTKVPVPVVSRVIEDSLSYAESLARDLSQQCAISPDRTSHGSDFALSRAIDSIRKTLPASLAAAAIDGLLRANDGLRGESVVKGHAVPETPPTSASQLGRNYRLGALDREQRTYDHHVNAVGARFASGDAPEAGLFTRDRLACFNPADQAVLGTLRKVLDGDEYSKLDAKQKLRVMGRTIRRQLHEAEHLSRKVNSNDGGDGDDDGDGEDDSTVGDSCRSDGAPDSRKSSETYERDSFCASDSELSKRSGSVSNSDSEGDDDRAEKRANSNNSLGTPATLKKPAGGSSREVPSRVLLGDEDLPLWKSGPARFKQGFHWESYLHHKQQYDNYKAHRGRYSERTFKSVIDSKLVPAVCASCGFRRSGWADLPDHRLILRLERVLRPSRSTDFAMELKKLQLEQWGDEPLQTSYSTFAEKFLGKVAEAADAGRPINSVVVKAAYKKAVEVEVPLKTWLEGVKWRGVDHAHQRLLRKLREARSWEAMSKSVGSGRVRRAVSRAGEEDDGPDQSGSARSRFKPKQRSRINSSRRLVRRGRGTGRKAKINNSVSKFQGRAPGRRDGDAKPGPKAEKMRTWRGYDQRGESWHTDKDLFECYKKPCNALFCNRCAKHGHTADYCRVPDGTDGLNQSGYFQEQRPGKAGPKRPPARGNSTRGRARDEEGSGDDRSEGASELQCDDRDDDGNSQRGSGLTRRSNSSRGRQGRGRL